MTLRLMGRPKAGPMPNYSDAEIYWTMYLMSEGHSVSRSALSESLGVGEGTTKNILKTLRDANLTMTFHTGTQLNSIGKDVFNTIPLRPVDIDLPQSMPGRFHQSVIVSGASGEAIKETVCGETSDCFILASDMSLMLSPYDGGERQIDGIRSAAGDLVGKDDHLVIGCGDTPQDARSKAIKTSLNLI